MQPTFANDEQKTFFRSRSPEVLYSGWMGAGKSRIICEKVWYLAQRYPGAQFGIFRKAQNSIKATTQRTFERDVMDASLVAKANRTESWFELKNGSRIYFMGLDPDPITGVPSKVGSLDLACAYVDEAIECTMADWIMLQGRLRDPRMPWHQLGAATNPGSPNSWLKQRFTPSTDEREYLNASVNTFLPADYEVRRRNLPDTVHGRRLGRGEWVAAEGVIYVVPDDAIRRQPGVKWKSVVAGIDWGYVHAFACEIVGISGSGGLGVLGELYRRGTLVEDIIPALLRVQDALEIEAFYADPSEPAYIEQCLKAGLRVQPATNAVSPGIEAVATALKLGMTIDPSCRGLLAELPDYRWAPDRVTGGLKEKPVEENDDACDALRYAVMGATNGGVLLYV